MTTTFPTSIDVISNPSNANTLADAGLEHDLQHDFANDAIKAIEAKVGVDSSAISTTIDYILHHHSHTGSDGTQVVTASAITSLAVVNSSPSSIAASIKAAASQTADTLQIQNSAGTAIGGIDSTGILYSTTGLLVKNLSAVSLLNVSESGNEVGIRNNGVVKGYTGEGTGNSFTLDASNGSLKLGGTTGAPNLWTNSFRSARVTYNQADGKNNANPGGIAWQDVTNADSPSYTTLCRTSIGLLQKTADGTLGVTDSFMTMGFPTYDGVTTATKSVGISVVAGTAPTLSSGIVNITGKLTVSDVTQLNGTLNVAGAVTMSTSMSVIGTLTLTVPPVLPSGAYAGSGAATTLARSDHSHAGLTKTKAAFTRTSGNFTITSTSWTAILGTGVDLVIAAVVNDWIEVSLSVAWNSEALYGCLDVSSIISGSAFSSWGSVKTTTDSGVQAWIGIASNFTYVGGSVMKQVAAGDIDGSGNVNLRIFGRNTSAGTKTIFATADGPFKWSAKNLGQ